MESKKNIVKRATNTVRIIAGSLRHRTIRVLDQEGLRPTSDRIRETVYNWIGHYYGLDFSHVHTLDLFAGTGAMGLEALSRGARSLTMIEKDKTTYQRLQAISAEFGIAPQTTIIHTTAQKFLADNTFFFSLIILDPPFQKGLLEDCLPVMHQHQREGDLLYVESSAEISIPFGYNVYRKAKAGSVYFYLLMRAH